MRSYAIVDSIRQSRMQMLDTAMPLLSIQYRRTLSKDPEASTDYCTLTIDHNSSDDSKLILLLNIGASSADYTQYQFSAAASGITDPGGVDSSPTHSQCTTLGALITALNAIDGISARRLHAPADYSLDTDDFITAAEFDVQSIYRNECLYRDVSEINVCHMRVGVPEVVDAGRIRVVSLHGTSTGNTNGTVKIIRDPDDESATSEEELTSVTQATAQTEYAPGGPHELDRAPIYRGPLLIEVSSDDLSVLDLKLLYAPADW